MSIAPPAKAGFRGWTRGQIYFLGLLLLVNLSNYLDRSIFAILQQPMKEDLRLEDWQLGIISGPAFAIFYSLAGIPAARIAERWNRVKLLSIAVATWSAMKALCGVASGFVHLAIARLGVGAAEGACTPTSHSLLADVFAPQQRGFAMSMLSMSIPMAQFLAPILGAVIAINWGWRAAFLVVGAPGILLAIVLWLTTREPREAAGPEGARATPSKFLADMKLLLSNRAFVWLFVANIFLGQSIAATNLFTASYFLRQYGLSLGEVGALTAVGTGLGGLVGTLFGGYIADRFARQYGRSYPLVCAAAALLSGIFFTITFTRDSWVVALVFLLLANTSTDLKNGPNFAAAQNMAAPHMRATVSAVLMVAMVVVGLGVGPPILGFVSDAVAASSFPAELGTFAQVCPGGKPLPGAEESLATACAQASAAGLRGGLMAPCVTYFIAALCFVMSARAIREKLGW